MKKITLLLTISITSLFLNLVNAATPYIVTTEGIGQYGYIEKDASPTYFRLSSADYGNIYQLFARSWISSNVLTYGTAPNTCAAVTQSTFNYSFGTLSAGNSIYSSVHADYCGGGNSYSGNPNQAGFNERSFFVMDVVGKTDALVSTAYYSLTNLNVVLSFTISNGNTTGQQLNRLWVVNDGTATEGTDINNAAFELYYEAATGSETFNGTESHATLYGDYNSNSTSNNVYGNDALNITIPQNNTGGLRCYVVLKGTSTYLNSTAIGKNVKMSIIADGISITPNRDTNFSLLKMDKTTPSANAITISDEYITTQAGAWNTSGTWLGGSVPPTNAIVTIAHNVTVDANITVNSLSINTGTTLSVAATKQLTVSTSLTNNGTLNLLSDNSGTATILTPTTIGGSGGTTSVQQYLGTTRNWYVSSPVSNAKAPSGFTYNQRDEAGASWTSIPFVATNTFVAGKGYIALPGSTLATLTFTTETGGQLNSGNVPVDLTYTSTAASKGFNLIGNPYPCHLTWTKTFTDANTSLIESTIYYRTNAGSVNNSGQWSFPTYNAFSGESVLGGTAIIPPMQAFWVRAKATGTLTLDSKLTRSHQSSNPLRAPAVITTDRQRLRLEVSNGTSTDETLLYFDAAAENTYDAYDSPKFTDTNATVQIYTLVGGEQLVINGMNSIPDTELPLGFTTTSAGTFSLKASQFSNFATGKQIILKDYANPANPIVTDISDGSSYTFSSNITSDNTTRFALIFKSPSVVTGINSNENQNIWISVNGTNQIVVNETSGAGNSVAVYNAVGQKLVSKPISGKTTLIDKALAPGVYMVTVSNSVKSITRKVIIN